jgi:adenylyl-sulfate kinase
MAGEGMAAAASPSSRSGAVVWLTGCPGAGKTTIARVVQSRLKDLATPAIVLDGDVIRDGLSADLDYSAEGRSENARRVAEVAVMVAEAGMIAIVALVSPSAIDRQRARLRVTHHTPPIPFLEVYVDAPPEVREARDPKGQYARARRLAIPNFTGLTGDYEIPDSPDVHLRTDRKSADECAAAVLARLTVARVC